VSAGGAAGRRAGQAAGRVGARRRKKKEKKKGIFVGSILDVILRFVFTGTDLRERNIGLYFYEHLYMFLWFCFFNYR
jgi:hypothetical protein